MKLSCPNTAHRIHVFSHTESYTLSYDGNWDFGSGECLVTLEFLCVAAPDCCACVLVPVFVSRWLVLTASALRS